GSLTIVSASMAKLGSDGPVLLTFTLAVNEPPGFSEASPKQMANAPVPSTGNVLVSKQKPRPREVVMLVTVTACSPLKNAAMYCPLHAVAPLLMVVDVHLPVPQLIEICRSHGWAARAGRGVRERRVRMSAARKKGPPWVNAECRVQNAEIGSRRQFCILHSAFCIPLLPSARCPNHLSSHSPA